MRSCHLAHIGFKLQRLSLRIPRTGIGSLYCVCSPISILMVFTFIWASRESLILCIYSHATAHVWRSEIRGLWGLVLVFHSAFALLPTTVDGSLAGPWTSRESLVLASHLTTGPCATLPLCPAFWVRGMWTQVLRFVWHTLYSLSHLPAPNFCFVLGIIYLAGFLNYLSGI